MIYSKFSLNRTLYKTEICWKSLSPCEFIDREKFVQGEILSITENILGPDRFRLRVYCTLFSNSEVAKSCYSKIF